jgi:hypothetical protein
MSVRPSTALRGARRDGQSAATFGNEEAAAGEASARDDRG